MKLAIIKDNKTDRENKTLFFKNSDIIQLNHSSTSTLGTEERSHCREVAVVQCMDYPPQKSGC